MWPRTMLERGQKLTFVGVALFYVGAVLLGLHAAAGYVLLTLVASAAALLAATVILVRIGRLTQRFVAAGLLAILAGGPWCFFMGWNVFRMLPKPDTIGYAEFHILARRTLLRIDLPPGWHTEYCGRDRHLPHEGYLVDEQDRIRFDVIARIPVFGQQKTLEALAREKLEAWQKIVDSDTADVKFVDSEFREGPAGKVWVERCYRRDSGGYGPRSWRGLPAAGTSYYTKWGQQILVVEFNMLAAESGELETLSWRLFQTFRL